MAIRAKLYRKLYFFILQRILYTQWSNPIGHNRDIWTFTKKNVFFGMANHFEKMTN